MLFFATIIILSVLIAILILIINILNLIILSSLVIFVSTIILDLLILLSIIRFILNIILIFYSRAIFHVIMFLFLILAVSSPHVGSTVILYSISFIFIVFLKMTYPIISSFQTIS